MNRPRKKRLRQLPGNQEGFEKRGRLEGWNSCCDEWEEWLPSVEKINLVIVDFFSNKHHQPIFMDALKCEELAEAISERLRR